jgi:hypothetical protein
MKRILLGLMLALIVGVWVYAEGGIRLSTGGLLIPAGWFGK